MSGVKRSDITDLMVCYACLQGEDELNSLGRLMEGTGAPQKVCLAAMRRADARGLIDWGVNIAYAWPTDAGHALMAAEHQRLSNAVALAREQGLPMTSGEVMEELRARQEGGRRELPRRFTTTRGCIVTNQPHARAFDLPGWPCPPRVRDIPSHENSWGYVPCNAGTHIVSGSIIAQDDLGYLWADGNAIPEFRLPEDNESNTDAILFWTEHGLGVFVHPRSLRYIGSISKLDMEPDRWIPIAVAAAELPAFVKG